MGNGIADKAQDIAEALLIAALIVGGIASQLFLSTNTTLAAENVSGMSAVQVVAWGAILTIAFASMALGFIRHMRKGGR